MFAAAEPRTKYQREFKG